MIGYSNILYFAVIIFFFSHVAVYVLKWSKGEFIGNAFPGVLVASSLNALLFVLAEILAHDEFSGYTVSKICLAGLPVCMMLFTGNHGTVLKVVVPMVSAIGIVFLVLRLPSRAAPLWMLDALPLVLILISVGVLAWSVLSRARNVYKWLCETTVDGGIADRVNFIYLLLLVTSQVLGTLAGNNPAPLFRIVSVVCLVLAVVVIQAIVVRLHVRHIFLLFRSLEKEVLSAVKMYMADMAKFVPGEDVSFRAIYDRLVEYFETEKPFLEGKLSIGDVSKHLLTNKVYISRAISRYTGKNFCQFVNFHRVKYAARLFQSDPHIKVSDLASMSGFNSGVTFTMAFRLYMNISPGEWCREIRASSGK